MKDNLRRGLSITSIILGSIFFIFGSPFLTMTLILFIYVTATGGYGFWANPIVLTFSIIFTVIGIILIIFGAHYVKKK